MILERDELGHKGGSSHGLNRIVRVTDYHPDYVRINRLALQGWEELQDAAGETLLVRTGNLEIGAAAQPYADALEAAGERFTWLAPEEARERWPSLLVREDERMFVQEEGGVCLADRTVRAAARLAVGAGAELREGTEVQRISGPRHLRRGRDRRDSSIRATVVVVAAGAWAGGLLSGVGLDLNLIPTLEQVSYFRLETPSALPTVIDYAADETVDHYAVPHPTEVGSFKIALDHAGPPVDPDTRSFDPDPGRLDRVEAWARTRFSSLVPTDPPETCLYTNAPDNDFVLDRRRVGRGGLGLQRARLQGQPVRRHDTGRPCHRGRAERSARTIPGVAFRHQALASIPGRCSHTRYGRQRRMGMAMDGRLTSGSVSPWRGRRGCLRCPGRCSTALLRG